MRVELTEEQKAEELRELIELYGEDMVRGAIDETRKKIVDEESAEFLKLAEFNLDGH